VSLRLSASTGDGRRGSRGRRRSALARSVWRLGRSPLGRDV